MPKQLNKIQILEIFIELDFRVLLSWKRNGLIKSMLKERMYEYDPWQIKFCYGEDQKSSQSLILDIT